MEENKTVDEFKNYLIGQRDGLQYALDITNVQLKSIQNGIDLIDEKLGTARLENLINISSNRIREPYYINNKIATITKKDNDAILKIIKKYYAFEEIRETNRTIRKQNTIYNKSKENREKVLT